MHNSKLKTISIALCIALIPISVFAAGLGKLNVMSGLGEPLKADIELISVTPEELNSITAGIASQDAYATQGIEKPASHNTIKVEVAKNSNGAPILKLKSAEPISEPYLDMLIQVDWSSGRLLREYTVLLDPPGYTGEVDSSAKTAQAPVVSMTKQANSTQHNTAAPEHRTQMSDSAAITSPSSTKKSNKRGKKSKPVDVAGDSEMDVTESTGQDYITHRGDSLAKIASEMKPAGISLEQMLIGLYQVNPNAFEGDNMNRLKVGQIIRQPSQETLSAISRGDAAKEIKVQTTNWNAYRNNLAGMVAESKASEAEANTQSAGGKIKSAAEDKSAPTATGPKDVVKLSAGESATKADSASVKALQDKIASLQEEATAREKSIQEAQDKTASLEKQIADMQKLLVMKNGAMADLQTQAQKQVGDKASAEVPKPIEAMPESKPAVPTAQPAEIIKPEAHKTETAKPVVKPTPITVPTEEPSFFSNLMDGLDLGLLLPAVGLLALLGGGWFYLRKKREKSLADFEQGIMTSGGLKANTVFGNTASSSVDTGDTSFLTDFSQSAHGGMIDTNDVDPIAEAEVYMAYGRDAQAEEILKDAIAKEPKRHELHLKLLEMYAASKNFSAFETVAGELYTSLGSDDPTWAKVVEIGIKLEPNNPLYQVNSHPTGTSEKLDATDFSDSPLASERDLDFSFDSNTLKQGFASTDVATATAELAVLGAAEGTGVKDSLEMDLNKLKQADVMADSSHIEASQFKAVTIMPADDTLESATYNPDAMDFDMSSFSTIDQPEEAGNVQASDEAYNHSMPSLDVPTFAAPHFMPESESLAIDDLAGLGSKTDELAETFEFPLTEAPKTEASGTDMHFVSDDNDFNFNIATITPEAESLKNGDFSEVNSFDLTTINLDLNESNAADTSLVTHAGTNYDGILSGAEPIEIETKLDLVVAYIEMDDKEGAKELLDEVMREGGANQRKRAEAILAKLA